MSKFSGMVAFPIWLDPVTSTTQSHPFKSRSPWHRRRRLVAYYFHSYISTRAKLNQGNNSLELCTWLIWSSKVPFTEPSFTWLWDSNTVLDVSFSFGWERGVGRISYFATQIICTTIEIFCHCSIIWHAVYEQCCRGAKCTARRKGSNLREAQSTNEAMRLTSVRHNCFS